MKEFSTPREFMLFISPLLRFDNIKENALDFEIQVKGEILSFPKEEVEEYFELDNVDYEIINENSLFSPNFISQNGFFETLVTNVSNHRRVGFYKEIETFDSVSGVNYEYSAASKLFFNYIFSQMQKYSLEELKSGLFRFPRINSSQYRRIFNNIKVGEENFSDLMRYLLPRLHTVKIKSETEYSIAKYETFLNSFLFQLSYQSEIPLVKENDIEELFIGGKNSRLKRLSFGQIEPPKRRYTPDLIHHYQLALSSETPSHQYLSFYHIIEHFFEKVFEEDLINRVKDKITHPGFSYKRRKDIKEIIREIQRRTKYRADELTYSEQEALKLTILKYVDIEEVLKDLIDYNQNLIVYYCEKQVSFCLGNKFDLNSTDTQNIINNLAKRIYKTRNAIVHSKDGNASKFTPFQDDILLSKEIPVIRFIAEQIIIKDSKEL